jgi:hypothetical protein
MPVLISTAVSVGVAALLFLQVLFGRVFFVSAVVMGWWWLGVIPLLILAYYGAYLLSFREHQFGSAGPVLAWLIASVTGLIALIYGNNMSMMLRANEWPAMYAAAGTGVQLNLADPSLAPRHLHMFLGAIAVTGLGIALLGVIRLRTDAAFGRWAVRFGAFVCGTATALNVFAGLWWLAALPREVVMRFMGQDMAAVMILLLGIFFTFGGAGLLILAGASTDQSPRPFVAGSVVSLCVGIVMMVLTRDTVRRVSLELVGFKAVTWTVPQWGPIGIFVVLLLVAVVSVAWMVRALVRGEGNLGGTTIVRD